MARALRDAKEEWSEFLVGPPRRLQELGDWCAIKAMEIGWDFYDLVVVLFSVQRPAIHRADEALAAKAKRESN